MKTVITEEFVKLVAQEIVGHIKSNPKKFRVAHAYLEQLAKKREKSLSTPKFEVTTIWKMVKGLLAPNLNC